ncbi:ABC transporter substrate-binding protein [Haloplanus halobius]|uniref:ABC transporter substrate-binding protein n=1 Tax=Haloplanus halobius TaxID=2934938 RepID=UPI00200D5A3E|nr:ABC transporter substrate-binding protein [Haloplanus sp. XH21]
MSQRDAEPESTGHPRLSRRRLLQTGAASASVTALAGCIGGGGGGSSGPVRVGVLSPLSGAWTVYGEAHRRGFELAMQEVNDNGGINGRDVEVIVEDTQTDPSTVTEKAQKVIRQDNVDVVAGTFSSASRNAAAPVVTQEDKVLLYPTFYEGQDQENFPGTCNDLLFMFGIVPSQQAAPWMDYMTSEHGSNFYMVGSDYVWPRYTNQRVKQSLEELGGNVVGEEYIPLGTSDFGSVLSRISNSDADIVFGTLTGTDTIAFAKQFYSRGLNEEFTYWTVDDEEFATQGKGPQASQGTYVSFDYFQTIDTDLNNQFVDKVKSQYGEDAGMDTVGAAMYNAGHMFANAANEVGSVNTDDIISGLEGQSFTGPQGDVTMREQDHQMVLPSYLVQVPDDWSDPNDFEGMFEIIDHQESVTPATANCEFPLGKGQ